MNAISRWCLKIKREKKESGQTLVEFALILPLLLLLVFGIIQFGLLFHTKLIITSAAREGARKAAVTTDAGKISSAIYNGLTSNTAFNLEVTNLVKNSGAKSGSSYPVSSDTVWWEIGYDLDNAGNTELNIVGAPVYIYIKGRCDITVPIISNIIGNDVPVAASAVMRIENRD